MVLTYESQRAVFTKDTDTRKLLKIFQSLGYMKRERMGLVADILKQCTEKGVKDFLKKF